MLNCASNLWQEMPYLPSSRPLARGLFVDPVSIHSVNDPWLFGWRFLVLMNYSWTILIGNLSIFLRKVKLALSQICHHFCFALPDIHSYHSLQIKLRDTLNIVVPINATVEKCLKEIFGVSSKYLNWLHLEDSLDVIQYQGKKLCNKTEANTDLLPLFWTCRLQLRTSRKSGPTCPRTTKKNPEMFAIAQGGALLFFGHMGQSYRSQNWKLFPCLNLETIWLGMRDFTQMLTIAQESTFLFLVTWNKGQGNMRTLFEHCFHALFSETIWPGNFTEVMPLDHGVAQWGGSHRSKVKVP